MNRVDVIRAWKDEEYRRSLSDEELAALPENPAGLVELNAADLAGAAGGANLVQLPRTLIGPLCPPRTFLWVHCPRTLRPFCPPRTLPVTCPRISVIVVCPRTILIRE